MTSPNGEERRMSPHQWCILPSFTKLLSRKILLLSKLLLRANQTQHTPHGILAGNLYLLSANIWCLANLCACQLWENWPQDTTKTAFPRWFSFSSTWCTVFQPIKKKKLKKIQHWWCQFGEVVRYFSSRKPLVITVRLGTNFIKLLCGKLCTTDLCSKQNFSPGQAKSSKHRVAFWQVSISFWGG